MSCFGRIDGQKIANNERRTTVALIPRTSIRYINSHVVIVTLDGEREATLYIGVIGSWRRASQGAARQHGFLLLIETNSAELLPVAYKLILNDKVMYGKFPLPIVSL